MENDMWVRICDAAALFCMEQTGVKPNAFKLPRGSGELAFSSFVRGGAAEAAEKLGLSLHDCRLAGLPLIRQIEERGGWLVLYFSEELWNLLLEEALALPEPKAFTHDHGDNRLSILARKPHRGLPPMAPALRRALWLAWIAYHRGSWTQEAQSAIYDMTQAATTQARLDTFYACGDAALAIQKIRRLLL